MEVGGGERKQIWNKAIWTRDNKNKKKKNIIVVRIKEKYVENIPLSISRILGP